MENDVVVKIERLHKKYCRNLKKSLWYGVRDITNDLLGFSTNGYELRHDEFWAVRDITFELKKGQAMGLIGRNGAGKTTLLKLVNGLIKPTAGKITINGSIGALIALGTGFNPILTGRENAKIAGAVLGFTERQMDERMDEILDFSEIGEFIDAPVKSYSSGMLVRLGFSVAIQLEPDILLVDEVLAVGDLAFMIKCQKKITEYRNNGGSMILVSHGMHNVRFHCDRAVWLDQGHVRMDGLSNEVCDEYERFIARQGNVQGKEIVCDEQISLGNVRFPQLLTRDDSFSLEIEIITDRPVAKPIVVISIFDVKNQHLISNYSHVDGMEASFLPGKNIVRINFDRMPLANGVFNINLVLSEDYVNNHLLIVQNCFRFEVKNTHSTFGILSLKPRWEVSHKTNNMEIH